jgi:OOP family OmpA-OmpF porin
MTSNIIDLFKGIFNDNYNQQTAVALGENESSVKQALKGIIPSVLIGLLTKQSSMGTNGLSQLIQDAKGLLSTGTANISALKTGTDLSVANKYDSFLNTIFGNRKDDLVNGIAQDANMQPNNVKNLLSISAPEMMQAIDNSAQHNNWDWKGIWNWIMNQKDNIMNAIPGGLNIANLLGIGSLTNLFAGNNAHTNIPHQVSGTHTSGTQHTPPHAPQKKSNSSMWIILLLLAALLAWWLTKDSCNKNTDTTTVTLTDTVKPDTMVTTTTTTTTTTKVDENGNYIYDVGGNTEIKFNDGSTMTVGDNSTEYKLYTFLQSGTIDENDKTKNWITCDRVYFENGKSVLTEQSKAQVENIATIMKHFPNAAIKLGGYTDNTGSADINKKLSAERAKIVMKNLKDLGVAGEQVEEAVGYGPEHPIASNDTDEGKAQNRRVDLKVSKK